MDSAYGHMIFNLMVVLAFIMMLMYVAKKMRQRKFSTNKHIKIINTVPIGAKERVILMEVNNTILLIGSTPNHIETLYVFNELDTIKSINDQPSSTDVTFKDQLKVTLN